MWRVASSDSSVLLEPVPAIVSSDETRGLEVRVDDLVVLVPVQGRALPCGARRDDPPHTLLLLELRQRPQLLPVHPLLGIEGGDHCGIASAESESHGPHREPACVVLKFSVFGYFRRKALKWVMARRFSSDSQRFQTLFEQRQHASSLLLELLSSLCYSGELSDQGDEPVSRVTGHWEEPREYRSSLQRLEDLGIEDVCLT